MPLLITTEQRATEPNYRARCDHGKIHYATSTCSEHSAALNLAARLLVGPKCGYLGYQQVNLVKVGPCHYEATLKPSVGRKPESSVP